LSRLTLNMTLLISTSWVAEITVMSHHTWLDIFWDWGLTVLPRLFLNSQTQTILIQLILYTYFYALVWMHSTSFGILHFHIYLVQMFFNFLLCLFFDPQVT
jgi:hypothetical protein